MPDLDRLLTSDLSHAAAQAAQPPDFSAIERRGAQRRRTRVVIAAAAAAGLFVLGVLGTSLLGGLGRSAPQPAKDPTPRPTGDALTTHRTPLRPDTTRRVTARQFLADEADTTYGGIDIREVRSGSGSHPLSWDITLRVRPPLASTLDPASRVIEHGVVVDADRDGDPDCQIGINTDSREPGRLRVWVTNLTTGVTDERVGGPYGFPFDFAYPGESATEPSDVRIFFLTDTPEPCAFSSSAGFYAYASVTDNGRVTEWDYAPDDAWLEPTS